MVKNAVIVPVGAKAASSPRRLRIRPSIGTPGRPKGVAWLSDVISSLLD